MTQTELKNEVEEIVRTRVDNGEPTAANWLTHSIVKEHPGIEGDDAPFYTLCAYEHVRDTVREVLRLYKVHEGETNEQQRLPGFERLQKAYLVARDDEQVVVPIGQMSDAEMIAKIEELEAMAQGCHQHALELRRYRDTPKASAF